MSWLDAIKARAVEAGREDVKPPVPARRTSPYTAPRVAYETPIIPKGEIHVVSVTTRSPSDDGDPGSREIGFYCVEGDTIVMCDETGKPTGKTQQLNDDDARLVASRLTRGAWLMECHSACNIDPLSRGIGVQN